MKIRRTIWKILAIVSCSIILCKIGILDYLRPIQSELVAVRQNLITERDTRVKNVDANELLIFQKNFSFPQPRVMRSLDEIKSSKWVHHLRQYLRSLKKPVKQIYLLTSNIKYVDVLLNWLISAVLRSKIPMEHILILSMDDNVHMLLKMRNFSSVLIKPSFLFPQNITFAKPFEMVMMLRLTVMRIINHFGFNVVMYDTDAIMLKDPQSVFDSLHDQDMIGTLGTIPDDLFAEWGVTICIGVVMVKSSMRMGKKTRN